MVRDFAAVVKAMSGRDGVERGRMFGSVGLKIGGKVFAMEVKGGLVVKLSLARAEGLIRSGAARPFDPGHGRPLKQWVCILPSAAVDWLALSREAKSFVAKA